MAEMVLATSESALLCFISSSAGLVMILFVDGRPTLLGEALLLLVGVVRIFFVNRYFTSSSSSGCQDL